MQNGHSPVSYGTFRFVEEDLSIPASERSFFASPAKKEVRDIRLPLYDYRSDHNITKGPAGLDTCGFTVANHKSALTGEDFLGHQVEDVYLKECEELVKRLTGAKAAVVNNVALRRKLATEQLDKRFYYKRGHPMDVALGQAPRDKPLGM
jgi:GA4 desaturase